MKYSRNYLVVALAAILCGLTWSDIAYDQFCSNIQASGTYCFNQGTLGACILIGSDWRGIEIAICDSRLCCDADVRGCIVKGGVCTDEVATTTTTTTSTTARTRATTPTTSTTITTTSTMSTFCVIGDLVKHPTNCARYYYCSNGVWVEAVCATGKFSDEIKMCVFGTCSDT